MSEPSDQSKKPKMIKSDKFSFAQEPSLLHSESSEPVPIVIPKENQLSASEAQPEVISAENKTTPDTAVRVTSSKHDSEPFQSTKTVVNMGDAEESVQYMPAAMQAQRPSKFNTKERLPAGSSAPRLTPSKAGGQFNETEQTPTLLESLTAPSKEKRVKKVKKVKKVRSDAKE